MADGPQWWRDFFTGLWQDVQFGMWSDGELSGLLGAAGFVDHRGFDSTTLEPFELGANRLTMVATKAD